MAEGLITQKEAAVILAVSVVRVRQLVVAKALAPARIDGKTPLFNMSDVEELRRRRGAPHARETPRAEAAAQRVAFEMFAAKKSLLEVMTALDLTAQKVHAMHRLWLTPLGGQAPKPTAPVKTFAELSEESAQEAQAFGAEFDREQAARRAKADRERKDRLEEFEDRMRGTK